MTTLMSKKTISTVPLFILLIISSIISEPYNKSRFHHIIYFKNTPYELHVYKIIGRQPGKKLLIIGGIHNEPGGYLTADHFVDMKLEKGMLIVVPRANFPSIVNDKRMINGDMNRKFAPYKLSEDYESQIVEIIKKLMSEADILLNLHEGSGFYRESYISKIKNPWKFGQSIIADTDIYINGHSSPSINLKEIAEEVIRNVNRKIENEEYHFRFNNHNTFAPDTKHPEQRRSATFFALSYFGIPSFGIESSTDIPSLETKVRHQIWIINEFMRIFNIIPEIPGLYLEYPELKFVTVSVNNENPIMIPNKKTLHIKENDIVEISYIEANYERGLTADILNYGSLHDFGVKIKVDKSTKIIIKKDKFYCGEIYVDVISKPDVTNMNNLDFNYLVLNINGIVEVFDNSHPVEVVKGDIIKIIDTVPSSKKNNDIFINFYGLPKPENNQKDDRNYEINTTTDLLNSYSINTLSETFEIRIEKGKSIISKFQLELISPELYYVVLKSENNTIKVPEGKTVSFNYNDKIEITEVNTNIKNNRDIKVNFKGFVGNGDGEDRHMVIPLDENLLKSYSLNGNGNVFEITVTRKGTKFGRVFVKIQKDTEQKAAILK